MGITTGYTGLMQSIETLKLILGMNKKCKNILISYNLIKTQENKRKIFSQRENKNNNINKQTQNIKSRNKINKIDNQYLIIDLRNKNEFNTKHVNRSINIPLLNFKINQTIKLIQHYSHNKKIVLYCNQDTKALIGSHILKNHSITNFIFNNN